MNGWCGWPGASGPLLKKGLNALENHVIPGSLGQPKVFEMAGKVAQLAALLHSAAPVPAEKPHPPADIAALKALLITGDLDFLNPIKGTSPRGLFY